jgi:hypothetical protein
MLTSFFNRLQRRFAVPTPTLGRWGHETNFRLKQRKIDLANEDHCHCYEYLDQKRREMENTETPPVSKHD